MDLLRTIMAFVFAMILLVGVHELGHLVVARWCGIRVIRFCIGMGSPIYTKRWRNIEWCFAPIPLGGYVKMVDTRLEEPVSPEDLPYAFDKQHPLKKIWVVLAGPFVNLVLAIVLFTLSFRVGGVNTVLPYVGHVSKPSIAASAGFQPDDLILRVNHVPVKTMQEAQAEIILALEAGDVVVDVENRQSKTQITRIIQAAGTEAAAQVAKHQADLGISAFRRTEKIGHVAPDSPAARAGLKAGDQIVMINQQKMANWDEWSKVIRGSAGKRLEIGYLPAGGNGQMAHTVLIPDSVETPDRNQIIGRIGVLPESDQEWVKQVRVHETVSWGQAVGLALGRTEHYVILTLKFFGNLITGQASFHHLSGPVMLADVAGQSVELGWQPYLEFLALVSMSLGVMNLLPIPVLDGGHFVYYLWEWGRGKPVSEAAYQAGVRFGVVVLLLMMLVALFNDLTRLFG